tara:strand:+ start:309 stop:746 length:438 start_codon:yes stop_codon:yes gene_type:complete
MDSICVISKNYKENLEICLTNSTFGIGKGTVSSHAAKSIQEGDILYIYLGGVGIVGTANASSKAIKVSEEIDVPDWKYSDKDRKSPPWTYLIPWINYQKIDPPYILDFKNGINDETGIKQGWLLQSMKSLDKNQNNKIQNVLGGI